MENTYHLKIVNGIQLLVPNFITHETQDYYVSYNNYDLKIYGSDTTAIVIGKTGAFLILNGDHREALRGMSLSEACDYFHSKPDSKNHKSDNHQNDRLIEINGKWVIIQDKD